MPFDSRRSAVEWKRRERKDLFLIETNKNAGDLM